MRQPEHQGSASVSEFLAAFLLPFRVFLWSLFHFWNTRIHSPTYQGLFLLFQQNACYLLDWPKGLRQSPILDKIYILIAALLSPYQTFGFFPRRFSIFTLFISGKPLGDFSWKNVFHLFFYKYYTIFWLLNQNQALLGQISAFLHLDQEASLVFLNL